MNVAKNTVITQKEFNSSKELPTNITQNSTNESNVTIKAPKRQANILNKQQKINSSLYNAVEELKFACSQKSNTNEFNIFGQLIACQLEKLPLEKSLELQTQILNIIAEARLSVMNDIHCTSDNCSTRSLLLSSNVSEHFEDSYDDCITISR